MVKNEYKMETLKLIVEAESEGIRLDKYISKHIGEGYSRTFVKSLIDNGLVHVNGDDLKPRYIVQDGDEILVEIPPPESKDIEPENIPIDILFEDEHIIVINKSAGMVVHPGAGNKNGTLVSAVLYHCGELPDADDILRPGIVHRLDKDTTGIIIVAKKS